MIRLTKPSQLLPLVSAALVIALPLMMPRPSYSIPAFSRMYNTSCSTCHLDFPKLNDFGKAFKDAGFKFPADDESMIKNPPVMLGAPAQAELWPHAIWPGKIPGMPPIGLRMNNFFQVTGKNRNNFQFVPAGTTDASVPTTVPKTNFETGLFSIFTAGNFGSDIAFWVDDDISVTGENGNGGLGDGYLRFVNLSRFLHLPKDSLNLRAGQFEIDLPFSPARSWNLSPWDIFGQTNVGVTGVHNVSNGFTLDTPGQGVEISGGHHYGGYWYSLALINQNTTGVTDPGAFVPTVTGSPFQSDSNFKDLYGHLEYRFNLEKDKDSRRSVQAAGKMGPRDHTYLSLGVFDFYGRSVNRILGATPSGTPIVLTAREPFYRVGGDFSFNFRTFNLFGVWLHGRDHNLVPVDAAGAPFPATPVAFIHGHPSTFSGGFVEADYLALPWVMLIMRYDGVNSPEDRSNGLAGSTDSPFFAPVMATRNRYTPGVQFLLHANIKASFEYQVRPRQQITPNAGLLNPVTLNPVFTTPFRVNTAVAGLEFVY